MGLPVAFSAPVGSLPWLCISRTDETDEALPLNLWDAWFSGDELRKLQISVGGFVGTCSLCTSSVWTCSARVSSMLISGKWSSRWSCWDSESSRLSSSESGTSPSSLQFLMGVPVIMSLRSLHHNLVLSGRFPQIAGPKTCRCKQGCWCGGASERVNGVGRDWGRAVVGRVPCSRRTAWNWHCRA